ncbi:hypothetical protein V8C86DRAFT_2440260 [Haematococcus lacustris]
MPDVEIAVTIAEIGFEERIWVTVGANYKDQRVTHPLTLDSDAQKLEWNAYFVALIVLHLRRVEYRPSMAPRGGGALYPPPPVRADSIFVKDMRGDSAFQLNKRRAYTEEVSTQMFQKRSYNTTDMDVVIRLNALYAAMQEHDCTVLEAAGLLADAVETARTARRRMIERHVLPDVIDYVAYKYVEDVGNSYVSAWMDNATHAFYSLDSGVIKKYIRRAQLDAKVKTAEWRIRVRKATDSDPPSRHVMRELLPGFDEVWAAMVKAGEVDADEDWTEDSEDLVSNPADLPELPLKRHPLLDTPDTLLDLPERTLPRGVAEEGQGQKQGQRKGRGSGSGRGAGRGPGKRGRSAAGGVGGVDGRVRQRRGVAPTSDDDEHPRHPIPSEDPEDGGPAQEVGAAPEVAPGGAEPCPHGRDTEDAPEGGDAPDGGEDNVPSMSPSQTTSEQGPGKAVSPSPAREGPGKSVRPSALRELRSLASEISPPTQRLRTKQPPFKPPSRASQPQERGKGRARVGSK